jgi:hypothetical protein
VQFVVVDSLRTPAEVAAIGADPNGAVAILGEGTDVRMDIVPLLSKTGFEAQRFGQEESPVVRLWRSTTLSEGG